MPIKFSEHAIAQIKRRQISKKRILETVNNPEEVIESVKNRRLRRKLYGGKILQAVTVTEGSIITVISGYYLRKKI